jgi:lipopolysaccharide/colanic/teichoic acid biosynthesis glycosyltransferase
VAQAQTLPDRRPAIAFQGRKSVFIKRGIDITVGLTWIIFLSALFAITALLIKLDSRGPVFFRQQRAGKNGRLFVIWKFRTMVHGASNLGLGSRTSSDDDRITRVGKWLRLTSLDELPQIINVLKGDMSLVGPRPTLPHQVERYTARQRRRLEVRPGITSWASVNGRNRLPWPERIELDIWYVDHVSLWLDLKILLRTLWVAFVTTEGVYAESGANDDFGVQPETPRLQNEPEGSS